MKRFAAAFVLGMAALSGGTATAQWQPADGPLMTRWAKDVAPDRVHAEYPRPQLVRPEWLNLNGLWDYAIRPKDEGRPETWDGHILVPFPVESALSGVMKPVGEDNRLWYRRTFRVPAGEPWQGKNVHLHFGAVDWEATVWVNGRELGTHRGGYDPFSFDITAALKPGAEQEVVVAVWDPTDAGHQPRGKQVRKPHGIWYTSVTGIWQTVWLEPVPEVHIGSLKIVPDVDARCVYVEVDAAGAGEAHRVVAAYVSGEGERRVMSAPAAQRPGEPIRLEVKDPALWSPQSPVLYELHVGLQEGDEPVDRVESYFAMRKISVEKDSQGVNRLFLNGKPLFQYGPLDQGWWPDGLYTAPSDEALRYDVETTRRMGFNMIRKHVKIEPARWYYWCDKLGVLVWQDMPSGDRHAPWNPHGGHDGTEIERSPESARQFRTELQAMIDSLRNHPSIVVWVPFNEAWGQFDTVAVTHWIQEYDPTRLVVSASGGNDFGVGDINDIHRYPGPAMPELEDDRAAVLGEFGGLGLPLAGHTWQDEKNWGYRSFPNKEELTAAYVELLDRLRPLVDRGLAAAVYTQTTDVEIEVNGLMTYDRAVMKIDPEVLAEAARRLYDPPERHVVVVPTSEKEPQTWRYTLERPSDDWMRPSFDDSAWKSGPGGFGTHNTPGTVVRTVWNTDVIWIRREAEVDRDDFRRVHLAIHHDEDASVYLNGVPAARLTGYTTGYTLVPMSEPARRALRKGKNTIAIECRQTIGGQYIDVGLVALEPLDD